MWKIYFFGAGKKGKYWVKFLKEFNMAPEGFIDNNQLLWGSSYEGVPVYAPDRLNAGVFDYVAVTCNAGEVIFWQLLEMGVEEDRILFGYHRLKNYLFYFVAKSSMPGGFIIPESAVRPKPRVLFDLQNGMVLGGVEAWVYGLAGQLKQQGVEGAYLTTDNTVEAFVDKTYPSHLFRYLEYMGEKEIIESSVRVIAENLPCTIICNFPQYIFWSACIAKMRYPGQVRIIAVQHNDDKAYYEAYALWCKYIDRCLAISMDIEEKLAAYGVDRDKMMSIGWYVSCDKTLCRSWSKEGFPIQIGYAGRVTVTQKRVDLLLEIALKLKEKNIRFCLNIAGTGNYAEIMDRRVQEEGLCSYVNMIGCIARGKIPDFWKKQDIMVSCSEWEGHSISQSEAMAAGAVPVVTDVSGARDDVADRYNGFVVPVGDLDAFTDTICFLYHNRGKMEQMGKHAHETVYKRQKEMDEKAFWDRLLGEMWNH